MKIIGINRGKIKVIIGEKSLTINGELTTTPIFYAEINSIKHWDYPDEDIEITKEERDKIIADIIEEAKDAVVKIVFD